MPTPQRNVRNMNETETWSSYLSRFYSSDDRRVDERLWPLGRVFDEGLPLARQPDELLLLLVKVRVDTMLEVGRSRDLDSRLLLFGKHDGNGCKLASDLQRGRREEANLISK